MAGEATQVDAIVTIMKSHWDLPSDCNEGELIGFAEKLLHMIKRSENARSIYAFLGSVQAGNLEIDDSDAYVAIAEKSVALVKNAA
jgi:hypothetical protein